MDAIHTDTEDDSRTASVGEGAASHSTRRRQRQREKRRRDFERDADGSAESVNDDASTPRTKKRRIEAESEENGEIDEDGSIRFEDHSQTLNVDAKTVADVSVPHSVPEVSVQQNTNTGEAPSHVLHKDVYAAEHRRASRLFSAFINKNHGHHVLLSLRSTVTGKGSLKTATKEAMEYCGSSLSQGLVAVRHLMGKKAALLLANEERQATPIVQIFLSYAAEEDERSARELIMATPNPAGTTASLIIITPKTVRFRKIKSPSSTLITHLAVGLTKRVESQISTGKLDISSYLLSQAAFTEELATRGDTPPISNDASSDVESSPPSPDLAAGNQARDRVETANGEHRSADGLISQIPEALPFDTTAATAINSTNSTLPQSLPDPSSNMQSSSDPITLKALDPSQRDLQTRYWGLTSDDAPAICPTCAKPGHLATTCPSRTCTHCGAIDVHFSRACPSIQPCSKCHAQGHTAATCPSKLARSAADGFICTICHGAHKESACCWLWRTFKPHNLGPALRKIAHMPVSCYECGARGHWGDDCPARRRGRRTTSDIFSAAYAAHFLATPPPPALPGDAGFHILGRGDRGAQQARDRRNGDEPSDDDDDDDDTSAAAFYGRKVDRAPPRAGIQINYAGRGAEQQVPMPSRRAEPQMAFGPPARYGNEERGGGARFQPPLPPGPPPQMPPAPYGQRPIDRARNRYAQEDEERRFGMSGRRGRSGGRGAR